jgi:ABC-type transporter Mla MlaB component
MTGKDDVKFMDNASDALPADTPDTLGWSDAGSDSSTVQLATGDSTLTRIALESTQSIQNVVELHEKLLRALEHGDKIEIDASATQQIDTSSLQLLLILKRSAITLQKQVSIDFPSERFIEAATLLGLAEMLEVDQAAAGFF